MRLVHLAREAINEELALLAAVLLHGLGHGVLEQLDGDLHGDDKTVLDVVADQVAELGAGAVLLGAKEIAGGEVGEAVVLDKAGALRALAGAGTAEDEEDGHIGGGEGRSRFGRGRELTRGLGGSDGRHVY